MAIQSIVYKSRFNGRSFNTAQEADRFDFEDICRRYLWAGASTLSYPQIFDCLQNRREPFLKELDSLGDIQPYPSMNGAGE